MTFYLSTDDLLYFEICLLLGAMTEREENAAPAAPSSR